MSMLSPGSLLYEIGKAEISVQSKRSFKQLSLLDLLEKEDEDLLFNSSENLREYRVVLETMLDQFNLELDELFNLDEKQRKKPLQAINRRLTELNVILNPKDKDLHFSRIDIPNSNRHFNNQGQIEFVRKKSLLYLGLQREIFRRAKASYKDCLKSCSPSNKGRRSKSSKSQLALPFPETSKRLQWDLEKSKLVELLASLDLTDAFGKNTSRKEIWQYFESVLGISLKNAESSLNQMKHRKVSTSKYLDELKDQFNQFMDK